MSTCHAVVECICCKEKIQKNINWFLFAFEWIHALPDCYWITTFFIWFMLPFISPAVNGKPRCATRENESWSYSASKQFVAIFADDRWVDDLHLQQKVNKKSLSEKQAVFFFLWHLWYKQTLIWVTRLLHVQWNYRMIKAIYIIFANKMPHIFALSIFVRNTSGRWLLQ